VSVYKSANSPFWQYDFQFGGHRFFGSTKTRTKRDAEKVEAAEREKAKEYVAQMKAAATSLRLDDMFGRYWTEVGQHHVRADNTFRQINLLLDFFGKDKLITGIVDDDIIKLVAWRRGHQGKHGALVSAFTTNDTTEQLKKIFTRAKVWGVRFDREPQWRQHWLKEPQEHVRELVGNEGERLESATRDDLKPFFAFAEAGGLRLRECLLQWSNVDWDALQIRTVGKGGRTVTVPITPTIRDIVWPLRGHHPEYVFTYVAQRTRGNGQIKGQRYPLTKGNVASLWKRLRERAGVAGFRFHDYRHNLASKLLRETGNLKLVQRALNHTDIKTTVRYAHVLDTEVAEALERVAKSRNKSRSKLREVS
jgi:integrase